MSDSGCDVDHMYGTHEESIVWLWLYAVVLAIETQYLKITRNLDMLTQM
jgi:hypothetical protein